MADVDEDVGELNYRELQHKLKALGLPAKGPDKILRERLADALNGKLPKEEAEIDADQIPEVEVVKTEKKASRKAASPKVEVKITTTTKQPKSPHTSPKPSRGRKAAVKEEEAVGSDDEKKTGEPKQRRQSGRRASLPKEEPRSPGPRGRRKSRPPAAHDVDEEEPFTPVDKIVTFAKASAKKVRKSIGSFDKEMQKRRVPWKWILPALLLALLLGSQWRHSMYWHRQLNSQLESLNSGIASLSEQTAAHASESYNYLYNKGSRSANRLYEGVSDSYQWALERLPLHYKLPEKACSAKLDTTRLKLIFTTPAPTFSLASTLEDVLKGHKENPLKATGVLLAGRDAEQLDYAAKIIQSAVPPECASCYLHLKGEDYSKATLNTAGSLQARLSAHIASCPYAIINIQQVNKIHPEVLPVLINVMSEQGALTTMGKSIATHNALFIGSTIVPAALLHEESEEKFAAAVKRDLAFQIDMKIDPTRLATPEAFRRRWDYVVPILKQLS